MVSDSPSSLCGVLSWKSVCVCECVLVHLEGALRVNPLPTPETGNGSNMGLSVASFKALGSDLGLLSGPERQDQWENGQSEKYRCFVWSIWNRRSLVGFTGTQRFINSVRGVADDELICQERFMSRLKFAFLKKGGFSMDRFVTYMLFINI